MAGHLAHSDALAFDGAVAAQADGRVHACADAPGRRLRVRAAQRPLRSMPQAERPVLLWKAGACSDCSWRRFARLALGVHVTLAPPAKHLATLSMLPYLKSRPLQKLHMLQVSQPGTGCLCGPVALCNIACVSPHCAASSEVLSCLRSVILHHSDGRREYCAVLIPSCQAYRLMC